MADDFHVAKGQLTFDEVNIRILLVFFYNNDEFRKARREDHIIRVLSIGREVPQVLHH